MIFFQVIDLKQGVTYLFLTVLHNFEKKGLIIFYLKLSVTWHVLLKKAKPLSISTFLLIIHNKT